VVKTTSADIQTKTTQGGCLQFKGGFPKCRARVWKARKTKRQLVMGVDVGLEESCNLSLRALVGRFTYKSQCKISLTEWMQDYLESLIGYSPELLTLLRGWFGFVFKNPEDTRFILGGLWDYEAGILMLKRWRIRFDPTTKYFSFCHLWVLLPGLPLQMWNAKVLEAIGNVLGHFIKVDEVALHSHGKIMTKVMVEVDIHAGLLESLEIDWWGHIIV